jgi:hypothetical protein
MPRASRLGARVLPATNARAGTTATRAVVRGHRIHARRGDFRRATTLSVRGGSVRTRPFPRRRVALPNENGFCCTATAPKSLLITIPRSP